MSVSNGYRTYILEQLASVPALSTRRMFGGVGLYSGELFFALIDDDVLFFKVDDANRGDYLARNMKAFTPIPGKASMSYFQVPEDVIEEADELARWARRSIEVAQRAGAKKTRLVTSAVKRRKRALPQTTKNRTSRRATGKRST